MGYGTLSSAIVNHYNKRSYTLGGTTYSGISIFKTNPSTQTIAPAVRTDGTKQHLVDMVPPGVTSSKVIAKTNASVMGGYYESGQAFMGIYYVNGTLYKSGAQVTYSSTSMQNLGPRDFPCFCLRNNGTVTIKWPTTSDIKATVEACSVIIAASNPLVYEGSSVFESAIKAADGIQIANWSNLNDDTCHYNDKNCNYSGKSLYRRTFIGHKSDGSFLLVCSDAEMDLRVGAKLMVDLECDFACNLDGSSATQMRVTSGYTNGNAAGRVTSDNGDDYFYGTAICAYIK
ncbi:phosphodiester glycosidase family protein [Ruminiclostridium papyrosolvens]|uniref:Phosphodiester glycosidase domain-containing protein n=1 Tax=Ruminiclostridium papyrosolvens C7 TaxID=1330534 RepID=U4QYM5_9FIRM|nr:phosphodiester glycosidase family protein [Ruminiclostridium papyrosolvens]EPR09611.1 hypothetical protein L323_15710 [Ruminiclostridium papyrosolvens C7]